MFPLKEIFPYTPMKHQTEDDDPEFDTLSLSDLPIYTHSSSDSSITNNSSSIHDQPNNDSFEFMKMDFRPQSHPEIVFCGKPIPCRETHTYQNNRYTPRPGSRHKKSMRYLLGTRFSSSSKTGKANQTHANNGSGENTTSNSTATSKSKWCFLVFGLQRFSVPTKMELTDIKYRQGRRSAKSMEQMLERSNSSDGSVSKFDKSLSYLLRSLSCKSNHSINVLD